MCETRWENAVHTARGKQTVTEIVNVCVWSLFLPLPTLSVSGCDTTSGFASEAVLSAGAAVVGGGGGKRLTSPKPQGEVFVCLSSLFVWMCVCVLLILLSFVPCEQLFFFINTSHTQHTQHTNTHTQHTSQTNSNPHLDDIHPCTCGCHTPGASDIFCYTNTTQRCIALSFAFGRRSKARL